MSAWKPISENELLGLIESTSGSLSQEHLRFFEAIRIPLQKWSLDPWGNHGDGFWAIGIIGQTVLWYNDIEDGFNFSTYPKLGDIGEYWCDQHDFDMVIRRLFAIVKTGIADVKCGPPQAIT